jgi:hypothetical protein
VSLLQPINVATARAQAFLMDYSQGERAITHHAGPVRIGTHQYSADWYPAVFAVVSGISDLTCLPKLRGARDIKFLVTHPMTDQCCLASAIVHPAH